MKYIIKGIAILITYIGSSIIYFPLNMNIITIVNNNAISAKGLILGTKVLVYHYVPFLDSKSNLVSIPPIKGIPK